MLADLENAEYVVTGVKKGTRKKNPAPPFITSTLQQEASRRLSFQARRTMKAAQELYEGVDVKDLGTVGLITYMRTDSLRISDEAYFAAKKFIGEKYGEKYVPNYRRNFKSRANAQGGALVINDNGAESAFILSIALQEADDFQVTILHDLALQKAICALGLVCGIRNIYHDALVTQ